MSRRDPNASLTPMPLAYACVNGSDKYRGLGYRNGQIRSPIFQCQRHGSADSEPRRDSCPARGVLRVRNTLEPIVRITFAQSELLKYWCQKLCKNACSFGSSCEV